MAASTVFAFFKPNALATNGYAYGSAVLPPSVQVDVSVTRISSGRWASLDAFECDRSSDEVKQRAVSKEEALSGIGTYVGSCVWVAKVSPRSPKAWEYGVVTGYTWVQERLAGGCKVEFVSIKYALDFSYYNDGKRRAPASVRLGDTIFDEPAAITSGRDETAQSAEDPRVLAGQLSDSDESDGDEDKAPPPAA
ncbi:hypothetical protein F443_22625, partial [Phytophthora nicotianae P1569]